MSDATEEAGASESFADIFGASERSSFKEGEIAKGKVLSIDNDFVHNMKVVYFHFDSMLELTSSEYGPFLVNTFTRANF